MKNFSPELIFYFLYNILISLPIVKTIFICTDES